ncbi:DUF2961 domain-containing protein [Tamlana agarivorans]|uniref:DUF2961 domain-containing protein n=1 Tax=Pseudotamlana agarivorans TaxID=481183 RepID=A0ACC5U9D9_9FLAO|nr:glycoside hydrolase family 172 protein [Tamlana agarivorans]MBU2950900.1 DUF2961 domain-containing protein [Tamlana agarivorans]
MIKLRNVKNIVARYCFILIAIIGVSSCSTPKEKEVSMSSLLNEMIDRDILARFPQKDFRLKQSSSYNRASKNPKDSIGWFTNHDMNPRETDTNFIRVEENNGIKEWVLMDHQGPGAIVRTWMPVRSLKRFETTSIIKIYLDGATEPTLEGNMLNLLNGTAFFPFPLAHKSLLSAVSFFPIPYSKSCKVTVTERPFFYQFTYREYAAGTVVKTFNMEDYHQAEPQIKTVCNALLNPKDSTDGEVFSLSETLNSNEEKSINLSEDSSAIRSLLLQLGNYEDTTVTRSVVLKMEFDGKETVWSPIGDFFGSGLGLNPFQGWYRTVKEDGAMSCRWVMPYQKSAKISVLNLGSKPIDIKLTARVEAWDWDENSMYFNAAWRGEHPVPTRPHSDWNYVTLKGRGVYVGDALTVMNPVDDWWGEGDEKIWVDNEDFPSIFGTGTEDYYGYSWGYNDFYEHPFHAQPRVNVYNKLNRKVSKEGNSTKGYSTETRTRSLDGIPFGSALQLDMEVWSGTDCDMAYGVGMYWYGDATTTSNRLPNPKGALSKY